jgi:hypothetical protein
VDGTLRMLGLSIQTNDRVVLAAHGTSDPSAYDQFLRGRGYLLDYHKHENIDSAISAFNRALSLDPKYAEAYAGLGKAYWVGYEEGQGSGEWMEKARSACNPGRGWCSQVGRSIRLPGECVSRHRRVREGSRSVSNRDYA